MALFGAAAPASAMMMPRSLMRKKKCAMDIENVSDLMEPIKPVVRKEFPETWIWETIQGTR